MLCIDEKKFVQLSEISDIFLNHGKYFQEIEYKLIKYKRMKNQNMFNFLKENIAIKLIHGYF